MEEEWKDIKGYEGLYKVSNLGKVKSMGHRRTHTLEKDLKPSIFHGYEHVTLLKHGKGTKMRVHRIVAQAFIPNPLNKPQINHIDGNKLNNCISNLEWATSQENILHAFNMGLNHAQKGAENRRSIKVIQMDMFGNDIAKYDGIREAERITGIDNASIGKVCKGKAKIAGGYKWRYSDG